MLPSSDTDDDSEMNKTKSKNWKNNIRNYQNKYNFIHVGNMGKKRKRKMIR